MANNETSLDPVIFQAEEWAFISDAASSVKQTDDSTLEPRSADEIELDTIALIKEWVWEVMTRSQHAYNALFIIQWGVLDSNPVHNLESYFNDVEDHCRRGLLAHSVVKTIISQDSNFKHCSRDRVLAGASKSLALVERAVQMIKLVQEALADNSFIVEQHNQADE